MGRSQRHLREIQGTDSGGHGVEAVSLPTIAGTPTSGQTLTGTNAQFAGRPTVTVTRAWLRNGTPISGATGATYQLQVADVGARISFRNTGANAYGSDVVESAPTAAVAAA